MEIRNPFRDYPPFDEEGLTSLIRELDLQSRPVQPSKPKDGYWVSLPVKINQRIDEATSGKALTLSWAYRVAIPGVIAILSFFIGLHYYIPTGSSHSTSVFALVQQLPEGEQDSLFLANVTTDYQLATYAMYSGLSDISYESLSEYLLGETNVGTLVEVMDDQNADELISELQSRFN